MTLNRRRGAALAGGAAVALGAVLLAATPAAAHTLDEYRQASYLTVTAGRVALELDTSVGVLVVPAVLPRLDADGDRQVSDAEARAYAGTVLAATTIEVDGAARTPVLDGVEVSDYPTLTAGYGEITIKASVPDAPTGTGTHTLRYRNDFVAPGVTKNAFQVTALGAEGVTLGSQQRDDTQREETLTYTLTGATGSATSGPAASSGSSSSSSSGAGLLAYVTAPHPSAWVVALAVGLAALLGAFHALTPGHGKTLMAAYLVGSRGTARDAVTLGGVVTFTHTASVIVIGVLALVASSVLVPDVLVPTLELVSGALVAGIGIMLLVRRRRGRGAEHAHDHPHDHSHDVGHGHGHGHGHDVGHGHGHAVPAGPVTARGVVALGISGGLVPCPEALGVMIAAVGVGRTTFGLLLIVAFSVGLAAVLVTLGLLLVRSRTFLERSQRLTARAGGLITALPVVGALVVTFLGLVLAARALTALT